MKLFYTILIFTFFSSVGHAQFVTNSKRAADVYFHNKEYYAAAEYYKRSLEISPDSVGFLVPYGFENKMKDEGPKKEDYEYSVFHLAESLRLYKNFKDAESWYAIAKTFSDPRYMLSGFWYGKTLSANQKYKEAIDAFQDFLNMKNVDQEYKDRANTEIASCRFALYEYKYPRLATVIRLANDINQKGSNYSPLLHKGSLYFTSSRPSGKSDKKEVLSDQQNAKVARKENPYLNAVYKSTGNPMADEIQVTKMMGNGPGKESAAPALHPNGKIIYITSWSGDGDKMIYQLTGNTADNSWSEPVEVGGKVNVKGFDAIQPFVSADGKYLMFSSNQPGGSGKFDLWYCPLNSDGTVGTAVNMGSKVNTPDDDEAPYYNSQTKHLLFSSNGRVGMGGYDFFESEGEPLHWSEPRNLGFPFNSSKDDMYFTPDGPKDESGYISSDRESLCCLEVFHIRRKYLNIRGILLDCDSQKPLADAKVTLVDSLETFSVTTGSDGVYNFRVSTNRLIRITAEKEKYFTKVETYSYDQLVKADTMFSPQLCLTPFEVDKPIVLKDVLYDFDKATLTEDSKAKLDHLRAIMVDNPGISIELSAHTDAKGTEAYNLDLSDRRAKSCVDYLISKGIAASRMSSRGYGESMPIAPNTLPNGKDNPEGRALNRRTEFKVTKK